MDEIPAYPNALDPSTSSTPPEPSTPPFHPKSIEKKYIAPLIALALFLPALVFSVLNRQSLFSSAKVPKCVPVSKVYINPGQIQTWIGAKPTEMSALAYGADNKPISDRVAYKWGISSTNSIGQLRPHQEIALFLPKRAGIGDIWVQAVNGCTKAPVLTSIAVTVDLKPRPTPTPTPIPLPTAIPTPTPKVLSVAVTSPNGGETLQVGATYRITWASSPTIDKVSLGYSSCPSCLDWIVNNIPNQNYYDWPVSVGNTVNTQFKIYIIAYETNFGSVTDYSDANFTVLPRPTPTPAPLSLAKRVFVSSALYSGNLGGALGADRLCQGLATSAQLGSSWKAWVTDLNNDVNSRFIHSNGRYTLVNGTVIANNWADLVDQSLAHSINLNEAGLNIPQDPNTSNWDVWTNTSTGATIYDTNPSLNCNNFTSNAETITGRGGSSLESSGRWTSSEFAGHPCNVTHHIYCFEQ